MKNFTRPWHEFLLGFLLSLIVTIPFFSGLIVAEATVEQGIEFIVIALLAPVDIVIDLLPQFITEETSWFIVIQPLIPISLGLLHWIFARIVFKNNKPRRAGFLTGTLIPIVIMELLLLSTYALYILARLLPSPG